MQFPSEQERLELLQPVSRWRMAAHAITTMTIGVGAMAYGGETIANGYNGMDAHSLKLAAFGTLAIAGGVFWAGSLTHIVLQNDRLQNKEVAARQAATQISGSEY